jgi:hypothetical protein
MRRRYIIIIKGRGPGCPRCGRPTQIREHDRIRPKQLRQPFYYERWFYCTHKRCKTTLYMLDAYKVWNDQLGLSASTAPLARFGSGRCPSAPVMLRMKVKVKNPQMRSRGDRGSTETR